MKTTPKWRRPQNKDNLKNEDDLKNEEEPINKDDPKNEDNPKKEDHFNNEDILNNGDDRKNKANILKGFHSSLGISNFAVFLFHHPIYPPQVKSLVSPVIYYDVTWQMETIKLPDHEQCQDYHHYQHYLPGDQDKIKHRPHAATRTKRNRCNNFLIFLCLYSPAPYSPAWHISNISC